MSTPNPARTPAGNGVSSGRFAAHGRAEDTSVTLEAPAPAAPKPLRSVLNGMHDGDSTEVQLPDGANCQIKYREYPAIGDNGQPVRGDVTGEYSVQVGGAYVSSVVVSPHGTSGYGNPRAKSYSAEEVERSIATLTARHPAKTTGTR